ncbi:hypothetical protein V2O64_00700 [Verrucomicrobiaceae bacterium 227]
MTHNKFDKVSFAPITTQTIRLSAKALPGHYAGMLEFQLEEK